MIYLNMETSTTFFVTTERSGGDGHEMPLPITRYWTASLMFIVSFIFFFIKGNFTYEHCKKFKQTKLNKKNCFYSKTHHNSKLSACINILLMHANLPKETKCWMHVVLLSAFSTKEKFGVLALIFSNLLLKVKLSKF